MGGKHIIERTAQNLVASRMGLMFEIARDSSILKEIRREFNNDYDAMALEIAQLRKRIKCRTRST